MFLLVDIGINLSRFICFPEVILGDIYGLYIDTASSKYEQQRLSILFSSHIISEIF